MKDSLECADKLRLVGVRAPADQGDRGFGAESGGDELGKNLREVVDAHVNNEGFCALCDRGPVDGGTIFFSTFVACNKSDARAVVAVGERDACVGWGGNAGGDSGDDFDGDAEFGKIFKFFAAASKDERVAAF